MPLPDSLPGHEARYAYMSTFHWMPLLNGYSGYYPPSYLALIGNLRHFPDEHAVTLLRGRGTRYVVVHTSLYPPDRSAEILTQVLSSPQLAQLGSFHDGVGAAVVFGLR